MEQFFLQENSGKASEERSESGGNAGGDFGIDQVLRDAWRYLSLKPDEVYALTPREYYLLIQAQQDKKFDQYDDLASLAMMIGKVRSAKKSIKQSDLFKRPKTADDEANIPQEVIAKQQQASEWLSQFDIK
ncbi:phage tail assembly chaperone [Bacillus subtilis]|nr:phage tail assembly chaperone [Bacillus subtilis]